jgi:hypothetical protein
MVIRSPNRQLPLRSLALEPQELRELQLALLTSRRPGYTAL